MNWSVNTRSAFLALVGLVVLRLLPIANIVQAETRNQSTNTQNFTNVVILFADNLAYDDVSIFRDQSEKREKSRTPNLDRAAMEGRRLLNWNSPAVLCSASRAALLTGKYEQRLLNSAFCRI